MEKLENKIWLTDEEIKEILEIRVKEDNLGGILNTLQRAISGFNLNNKNRKFDLVSNVIFSSGNIRNNPKDLKCKMCGGLYIIKYEYGDIFYRLFNGSKKQKSEEIKRFNNYQLFVNMSPYEKGDNDYDYCCLNCGYEWSVK